MTNSEIRAELQRRIEDAIAAEDIEAAKMYKNQLDTLSSSYEAFYGALKKAETTSDIKDVDSLESTLSRSFISCMSILKHEEGGLGVASTMISDLANMSRKALKLEYDKNMFPFLTTSKLSKIKTKGHPVIRIYKSIIREMKQVALFGESPEGMDVALQFAKDAVKIRYEFCHYRIGTQLHRRLGNVTSTTWFEEVIEEIKRNDPGYTPPRFKILGTLFAGLIFFKKAAKEADILEAFE